MSSTPMAPDVASDDRLIASRSMRRMPTPPPFLGATVIAVPRCCSAVVIAVGTVGPVDAAPSNRRDAAGTAVIVVDVRDEGAVVERQRQIVATYRWLLNQQVDPPTVTLVVPDDVIAPLRAFFAHCGDPAPGAFVSPGSCSAATPSQRLNAVDEPRMRNQSRSEEPTT